MDLALRSIRRAQAKGASRKAAARVACTVLTKAAMDRGSRDNITVVIIDLAPGGHGEGARFPGGDGASPRSPLAEGGSGSELHAAAVDGAAVVHGAPPRAYVDLAADSPFATADKLHPAPHSAPVPRPPAPALAAVAARDGAGAGSAPARVAAPPPPLPPSAAAAAALAVPAAAAPAAPTGMQRQASTSPFSAFDSMAPFDDAPSPGAGEEAGPFAAAQGFGFS
jgi:hypothetical protein